MMSLNTMSDMIQDTSAGLFKVHQSVFTDPELFVREQETIFNNCWVYVGHEAEIPKSGNFIARTVVGRKIIFVRDSKGQVRVFFNTCRHWGAMVCRHHRGTTTSFQCFYHGWTYNTSGHLIGLPDKDAYPDTMDREDLGLVSPPKVDSYRGFVFMSLNSAIISLHDYLAGAKKYIDLVVDQAIDGMEIIGGEQKYGSRANWKLLAVNSVDVYHAAPAHQTYFEYLKSIGVDFSNSYRLPGKAMDLGNGHTVVEFEAPWGRPIAKWAPYFPSEQQPEIEKTRLLLEARYGLDRAYRMTQTSRNMLIFPNLNINDHVAIVIRTYNAPSPDSMEVTNWALAPKNESGFNRALRLDNFLTFLGPGGFATPDDVEAFESCQRAFANREVTWVDVSKGASKQEAAATDELQMRVFWRQWHRLIQNPELTHSNALVTTAQP